MFAAARRSGAALTIRSSYRSYSTQVATFNYWVRIGGFKAALHTSARPGHSEHQLGTTIDFRSASSQQPPWNYPDWITTPPGAWMNEHAWEYGFVMSYPRGKRLRTCMNYEPWHYRYIGRHIARQVHESGLTLRRYLWDHVPIT